MSKKYVFPIYILLFFVSICTAQQQSDTTVLSYKAFVENVIQYHPIAQQATLRTTFGDAEVLKAKGNFDPKLYADWSEKNFKDKRYYRTYSTKLRVPTPLGLDVVGGYENTSGDFLNPERKTDKYGLWHLGVELNVLQGLFINQRKTVLQQANVFQQQTKNEQKIILNELIYNASYAYLQWQMFYHFQKILTENKVLSEDYLSYTTAAFEGGEKTAMDTLEAHLLYQDAILDLQKNEIELVKARLTLENYLWYDEQPIELLPTTTPERMDNELLSTNTQTPSSFEDNPTIIASLNKLTLLEIEQKLKREKLKPKLKVKYNPLLTTSSNSIAPKYSADNYAWGFVFSMPLFLRSERANIQQGKVKINEVQLSIKNKRNELQNKIQNALEVQQILERQQTQIKKNTSNYKQLLDGEKQKFDLGESSVFLLNKRQNKYISARIKLIQTQVKLYVERLKYLYYTNGFIYE